MFNKFIKVLFSLLLCLIFLPLKVVRAEDLQTYIVVSSDCTDYYKIYSTYPSFTYISVAPEYTDVRAVVIDSYYDDLWLISSAPFSYKSGSGSACSTASYSTVSSYYVVNGVTYYYLVIYNGNSGVMANTGNFPVLSVVSDVPSPSGSFRSTFPSALYYTFGAGSVGPEPVITYGEPVVSYSVSVAGSGVSSVNNVDVISWKDYDTLNNFLPEDATISLRVIPGTYQADSQANIFLKTYQDFTLDTLHLHDLGTYSASLGSVSFSWGDIIDNLDNYTLSQLVSPYLENELWKLWGWSYEARLNVGDSYHSSWVPLYSVSSSGVDNSQTIINSTSYDFNVYQSLVDLTTINNDNSTTYNYYGDDYTVYNYNINNASNNGNGGKSTNFWDFLISLMDNLIDGLGLIKDSVADVLDFLGDLFSGLFTFDAASDIQEDAKENSGLFGESLDLLTGDELSDVFYSADTSSSAVLSYPGFYFNDVLVIPPVDLDFGFIYLSTEEGGLGLDQSLVYTFTDFWVFFSLFILLIRKFKEVMR